MEKIDYIPREKWLAALHVKGAADEPLKRQMDQAETLLLKEARPRFVYKVLEREALKTEGFSIQKHLEGCRKVVILAVTLGIGIDNLLRRMQVTDMAMAVILDCGASVYVEAVCDDVERQIREQLTGEESLSEDGSALPQKAFLTSRFSPGYGDYPITHQGKILALLDAARMIGLNVTSDSLMIPRKSITAVMGMADHPVTGRLASCGECVLREKCTLRKEGKFCGN